MAIGGFKPGAGVAPFLGGVDRRGRRACSPFDLGCEGCPGARGVPPGEAAERAGEDRGVALEPKGREAGLWRPPPALGRLLAAGLGSAAACCGVLLTDFLGASVGGRGRALGAARGRLTSAPAALDRREVAGEGAPGEGPEESGDEVEGQRVTDTSRLVPFTAQEPRSPPKSPGLVPLRAPALSGLLLGVSGAFPLTTGSSAGGRSPFWAREPSLGTGVAALKTELCFLPSLHFHTSALSEETHLAPSDLQMLPFPQCMCKIKFPDSDTSPCQKYWEGILPGGPADTSRARDRAWACGLGRRPLPSPNSGGPGGWGKKAKSRRCPPPKEGEAEVSEGKRGSGAKSQGLNGGKRVGYLDSGGLSQRSELVPLGAQPPGERLPGYPQLAQPGALVLQLPLLPELGAPRWLRGEGVEETLGVWGWEGPEGEKTESLWRSPPCSCPSCPSCT